MSHAHHWHQPLSRRGFLAGSIGLAGAGILAGARVPTVASEDEREPRPIPGSDFAGYRFYFQEDGPDGKPKEQSSIFDFRGVVGSSHVRGTGIGTTPAGKFPMYFDTDMRFMKGDYIALNGKRYSGSFGFI